MAALCPNCHREIHHGVDGRSINERLQELVPFIGQLSVRPEPLLQVMQGAEPNQQRTNPTAKQ
jgi:hypothetical protein